MLSFWPAFNKIIQFQIVVFLVHQPSPISIRKVEMLLVNSYSAGIDFSRQNLTSVDVRF